MSGNGTLTLAVARGAVLLALEDDDEEVTVTSNTIADAAVHGSPLHSCMTVSCSLIAVARGAVLLALEDDDEEVADKYHAGTDAAVHEP